MARRPGPRLHRLPQRLDYTLIPAPLDLSLPLIAEKSPLPAIIVTPSSPSEFDLETPWRHGHSSPDVHTHDYSNSYETTGPGDSNNNNYSIAFLAPPKKPTLSERFSDLTRPFRSLSLSSSSSSSPSYFPITADLSSLSGTPSKSKFRFPKTRAHLFNGFGFGSFRLGPLLLLSLILFVMICHLITHQLASGRPHLDLEFASAHANTPGGIQGSLNLVHGNGLNGMNGHVFMGVHGSLGKMVPGPGERDKDSDSVDVDVSDASGKSHETGPDVGTQLGGAGESATEPEEGRLDDVIV